MSNDSTQYVWCDYDPRTMQFIESWLDKDAVKATGLDDGFRDFYEYWANEDGFDVGVNYWCKVVCENNTPVAVVAFCRHEQMVLVMEIVVKPQKRGQGVGTKLLKELLGRRDIINFVIQQSEAVIFSNNIASQRVFEKAGYQYHHTDEDGTAMYYVYRS